MSSFDTRTEHMRLQIAEPRAVYLHRPPLVTDASVIAAAVFGELHAPYLLDHEIASVALKKLRREKLHSDTIAAALQAYGRLHIERHSVDADATVRIAERYDLTAYDAAYLYVAQQLTAPFATLDARLAAAARLFLADTNQVHDRG